jgi:hypothetical protein
MLYRESVVNGVTAWMSWLNYRNGASCSSAEAHPKNT